MREASKLLVPRHCSAGLAEGRNIVAPKPWKHISLKLSRRPPPPDRDDHGKREFKTNYHLILMSKESLPGQIACFLVHILWTQLSARVKRLHFLALL